MTSIKSIAVFCGSSTGHDPVLIKDSLDLAAAFCAHDITLVYGGGNVGLMGVLADEMLRLGGRVIGVIPERLVEIEVAHKGLTQLHVVKGMHERKALMTSHSDAFMVLPGGIGTMEEFFEIYTWQQLGYHQKPIAISNINGFYDILISFLKTLASRDFVKPSQIDRLIIAGDSVQVLNALLNK
ncbi:MAG TPA: TIGR00730 family Rossman fold protein [Bacteroidales bacterium]|nr:TIGR00730 family Rossman fold protein [Bacteroidales bacterium]